jgi:hypothetical protein
MTHSIAHMKAKTDKNVNMMIIMKMRKYFTSGISTAETVFSIGQKYRTGVFRFLMRGSLVARYTITANARGKKYKKKWEEKKQIKISFHIGTSNVMRQKVRGECMH